MRRVRVEGVGAVDIVDFLVVGEGFWGGGMGFTLLGECEGNGLLLWLGDSGEEAEGWIAWFWSQMEGGVGVCT